MKIGLEVFKLNEITAEADVLLCTLYDHYYSRRINHTPKSQAVYFGTPADIHHDLFSNWLYEDLESACLELAEIGFIVSNIYTGDLIDEISLSNRGIIYMEEKFENRREKLHAYLERLISKLILP